MINVFHYFQRLDSYIAGSGSLNVDLELHYVIQHSARNMIAIKNNPVRIYIQKCHSIYKTLFA